MAERNIWSDVFGISHTTSSISTAANAAKGIPLINHPNFEAGTQIINQRKATGTSYRDTSTGMEYQQGVATPTTSWEFDINSKNMSRILWSLFQKGSFQGASSVYPKYFVPFDDPGAEVWLNLIRKLAVSGDSNSHRIKGAMATSITISAEEGQNLKATAEFNGYGLETNHNIASDTLDFDLLTPLSWSNATVTLDNTTVNIPGFSITISNNATTKFYDNANAVRHNMVDFTVEGNYKMPWAQTTEGGNLQLNDFILGTTSRLVIYWGDSEIANADNEFSIIMNIRKTGAVVEGDDEIVINTSFEGACTLHSGPNLTTSASSVAIADSTTVTGTSTEFDSFNEGDLFYCVGATATADRTVRVITAITSDTSMTVFPKFSGTEGSLNYKLHSTPCTITVGDSQSISGM